jgi:hypothetical protein
MDLSTAVWRKSSYSQGGGNNCVEVAAVAGAVAIRDSKDPAGPAHVVSLAAFGAMLDRIKRGELGG